jgi:hypothetical protein
MKRPNPNEFLPTDFLRGKYLDALESHIDYLETLLQRKDEDQKEEHQDKISRTYLIRCKTKHGHASDEVNEKDLPVVIMRLIEGGIFEIQTTAIREEKPL